MTDILVIAEGMGDELRTGSIEAIAGAVALRKAGERIAVAVFDPNAAELSGQASIDGVDEVFEVHVPEQADSQQFESAMEQAIAALAPSLVLVAQSVNALGFVPAVAARGGYGFASDVTSALRDGEVTVERPAFRGRLNAELRFPLKSVVVLMLRQGAFEASRATAASVEVSVLPVDCAVRATEHLFLTAAEVGGEVTIEDAEFLLAIGRGVQDEDAFEEFSTLADQMGATLCASRPLVDAGLISATRQVGQSGRSVEPKVYLAFGISGAVQHVVGMAKAKMIIAVNTDATAPIFRAADYGAVADMYEIASELNQLFE